MGENQGVESGLENRSPHIEGVGGADDMTTPKSKRTTPPAYQFYPGDFLKDENVLLMSFTEIGIYQVLLCHAWTNRGLPKDTADIAKMLKMPHLRFKKVWHEGALHRCFVSKGERLVNPRQELERQKQDEFRRRQSDNAKKPRPNHSQPAATAQPNHSQAEARALKSEDRSSGVVLSEERDLDVAFIRFRDAYPSERRKGGRLVEEYFLEQANLAGKVSVLFDALANHRRSEQWSNPKHIPGMDVWLREERWRQVLPPAGAATSSQSNPKTAGNIAALQRFIDRGKAS